MNGQTTGTDAPADLPAHWNPALALNPPPVRYALRLYIAGNSSNSIKAIANIKSVCDEVIPDAYHLQVIDIYQEPSAAVADQIVAVPTLVKASPEPLRRLIGDMSSRDRVLAGLGLSSRNLV